MGPVFEQICLQYLVRQAKAGKLPFVLCTGEIFDFYQQIGLYQSRQAAREGGRSKVADTGRLVQASGKINKILGKYIHFRQ